MILLLFVAVPAAFVLGLAVESHWCGHRHQASGWEAKAQYWEAKSRNQSVRRRNALRAGKKWMDDANHWHTEFEREKRTSESHAAMLAALGRAVAEGQSVNEGEVHEQN